MQALISELNQICSKFPYKEKVVIVDSHSIGEQINEAFVKEGHQAINLKYKTVIDLAQTLVDLNSEQPQNSLDHTVGVHFTYNLLKELKNQDKLRYFAGMEITPAFSHAIFTTIQTLHLAGYTKDTLKKNAFINPDKAEDFYEILAEYENKLISEQFTDKAGLLNKALETAQINEKVVFILQSGLTLSHLEDQFLRKIIPETVYKLPLAPVLGVNTPERSSLSSIHGGPPTPLSYLYQQEETRGEPNLVVFTAKTEEMEVKQILEKIKVAKSPLDKNVVYYTDADAYITQFYHLSQKMDLPMTFGEGLPVSFSRPGRLVSGLVGWIQSNYSVPAFLDMFNEGLLELGKKVPFIESGFVGLDEVVVSKSKISRVLRDLQIGWSQERYLKLLSKEFGRLSLKCVDHEEDPYYENPAKEMLWIWLSFEEIFKKLPPLEPTMNYKKCLTGIAYVLKNNCKTNSAFDEIAKSTLLEEIQKLLPYADEKLPSYDVFEKIKDLLLSVRINQSRPKPGHLHVSTFKSGIYNSRPNVFFVGLDNKKFPGNVSEDPLLLDAERIQLGNGLRLLREKGQENLYTLLQVLANSNGHVTVSYCHFDMNENRVVNPAFVVLQCYRLITGNIDAEFKSLKSLPSSIIATDIFEDKDYWNEKLTNDSSHQLNEGILTHFNNVKQGIAAETARNTGNFSEYDGLVQIDDAQYDPSLNQEKTLSAGKLETIAKCPYSYFLREVLKVRPVDDFSFDANKWMDAATRGSLLHSIFENFYKKIQQDHAKPSYEKHLELIISIAQNLMEQQKEVLPPPNERVYQRERSDILACCEIFLKEEMLHSENYEPLYFEYSFGMGEKEPAIITLPSGEVKISGIIDRVDQSKEGKYHIIDYKTGSTYGYAKNAAFKGGRQLQHMIYALAIEQHLNLGEGAVEESSYYFPTPKGLAQRFTRKQDRTLRTNGIEILEKLIDTVTHGHFEMTDDVNDCKFCEYKLVCRRHFYNKESLEMKQSNQKLKGVRAYD
ncbi:PD-(D/E)XK nuclease family protein [Neobacillus sp. C211]|uniref:PD-(D/E)XK nuclease family protein n=1 Tax=unclassified Neobacillus TaxID=2675272 RepID=UPI003979D3FF